MIVFLFHAKAAFEMAPLRENRSLLKPAAAALDGDRRARRGPQAWPGILRGTESD